MSIFCFDFDFSELFLNLKLDLFFIQNSKNHPTKNYVLEFLRMMSVCHTVIPEKVKDSDEMLYHASSPGF